MPARAATMKHLIIIMTGKEDGGRRATMALSIALSALASNDEVKVFLSMNGICWASPACTGTIKVEGFDPVGTFVRQFIDMGGEVLVCGTCLSSTQFHGSCGGLSLDDQERLPGTKVGSTMSIVEHSEGGTVYVF